MAMSKSFSGSLVANRAKKIQQLTKKTSTVRRNRNSPRLYMKGTLAGYTRGLHGQNKNTALVRIENVNTKDDATWYVGKRVCYVYHGYKMKRCVRWSKAPARRSNTRAIWGRVTRPHGGSGTVRVKFNGAAVPASAIGRRVRVYLYPSRI
ncbi:Ribosomal protein L35A [Trypanosoma melophagium]|uniref:Ribosomal protein L35A n=1 Tax=Trypanosoma melophagium TaxID=715481 RepID=UPI00351AAAAD|nr:Ribosomal protein L35A [Trypanosoma melophagium]